MVNVEGPSNQFPGQFFPTVFADTVLNLSNNPSVVKFYLARIDPSFTDTSNFRQEPVAQVVMPIEAFATTAVFFENALKRLVELGAISNEKVQAIRNQPAIT